MIKRGVVILMALLFLMIPFSYADNFLTGHSISDSISGFFRNLFSFGQQFVGENIRVYRGEDISHEGFRLFGNTLLSEDLSRGLNSATAFCQEEYDPNSVVSEYETESCPSYPQSASFYDFNSKQWIFYEECDETYGLLSYVKCESLGRADIFNQEPSEKRIDEKINPSVIDPDDTTSGTDPSVTSPGINPSVINPGANPDYNTSEEINPSVINPGANPDYNPPLCDQNEKRCSINDECSGNHCIMLCKYNQWIESIYCSDLCYAGKCLETPFLRLNEIMEENKIILEWDDIFSKKIVNPGNPLVYTTNAVLTSGKDSNKNNIITGIISFFRKLFTKGAISEPIEKRGYSLYILKEDGGILDKIPLNYDEICSNGECSYLYKITEEYSGSYYSIKSSVNGEEGAYSNRIGPIILEKDDIGAYQVVPGAVNFCGDNRVDKPEQCEGDNLNGETCESLGFDGGALSCNNDCTFNTLQCTNMFEFACGNNQMNDNEQCDGDNLNSKNCQSLGYDGGALSCNNDCTFNTLQCTNMFEFADEHRVTLNGVEIIINGEGIVLEDYSFLDNKYSFTISSSGQKQIEIKGLNNPVRILVDNVELNEWNYINYTIVLTLDFSTRIIILDYTQSNEGGSQGGSGGGSSGGGSSGGGSTKKNIPTQPLESGDKEPDQPRKDSEGSKEQDIDGDGLPDYWEIAYFGDLSQGAYDDFDGDGILNIDEYTFNTDPTLPNEKKSSALLIIFLIIVNLLLVFLIIWGIRKIRLSR